LLTRVGMLTFQLTSTMNSTRNWRSIVWCVSVWAGARSLTAQTRNQLKLEVNHR